MASFGVDPALVRNLSGVLAGAFEPMAAAAADLEQMPEQLGIGDLDGRQCDEAFAYAVLSWQNELERCQTLVADMAKRLKFAATSYDDVERANTQALRPIR